MATTEHRREKRGTVIETAPVEGGTQPKRLRLVLREPSALACLEDAQKAEVESAAVKSLVELREEWLPSVKPAELLPLALELLALIKAKSALHLLQIAAQLFKEVMQMALPQRGSGEFEAVAQCLAKLVTVTDRESIRLPVLLPLLVLVSEGRNLSKEPYRGVGDAAKAAVSSTQWAVRREALSCLSAWCGGGGVSRDSLVDVSTRLSRDADPRVRTQAVACLAILAEKEPLPLATYDNVSEKLDDEDEGVRLSALPLLQHFATHYSAQQVGGGGEGGEGLGLVDDAFCRLCHSMNDASLAVRTTAAELLGRIEGVGHSFLEQTLDKKLMSAMRRQKISRYAIGSRGTRSSEWSTGKQLGHDAPAEMAEDDSTSLIPSGACGAFVTGLEDEFMGVRQACVRSLSRLAARIPSMASKALDFLADMFNDEIAEVRLEAMECLGPLVRMGTVSEDQMEVILGVLDDVSAESRAALRRLLTHASLPTITALHTALTALLRNLHKYPGDRESICQTLAGLGRRHPSFLLALTPKLLGLHPYFDISEPPIDDPVYVAKLILVLNAAKDNGPLMALFPPHLWRHHLFLRHAHPHLVPPLHPNNLGRSEGEEEKPSIEIVEDVAGFQALAAIQRKCRLSRKIGGDGESGRLAGLEKEARALADLGEQSGPGAGLLARLCQIQAAVTALARLPAWDRQDAPSAWHQAWEAIAEVEGLFSGGGVKAAVASARLRLALASLALAHKSSVHVFPLHLVTATIKAAQQSRKYWRIGEESDRRLSEEAKTVLGSLEEGRKPGSRLVLGDDIRNRLLQLLQTHPLGCPQELDLPSVQMLTANLVVCYRLWRESEGTLRLTAGLSVAVQLLGEVWGLEDVGGRDRICLEASYPDQRVERTRPRPEDWHAGRLNARLVLSASLWTHKAPVPVRLVLEGRREDEDLMRAVDRKELASKDLAVSIPSQLGPQDPLLIMLHPRPPR